MWKFKEIYKNNTICTAGGGLINAANITDEKVERLLTAAPKLAYYFEKEGPETAEAKPAKKPTTSKKK